MRNILHVKEEEVGSLLDAVDNKTENLLKFAALKSYFAGRYTCFWNPGQDDYMHICRQIYYIKEFYEKKQSSGECIQEKDAQKQNRQTLRTYGCFGSLLHYFMPEEPSENFSEKLREHIDWIEKKILEGRSRMELQSLQMAVRGTISGESIALWQLKYLFEGSVFQKVVGVKGEDFENVMGIKVFVG